MNKRFVIILAVLVIGFAGLLIFSKRGNETTDNNQTDAQPSDHTIGEGTSGVTLTEFGDFQCPACAQYFPLVKQVVAEYGDEINFRFRHFPLQAIHQNALISSRAAEAAGLQDKFWEMHDILYERQTAWAQESNPAQIFEGYAEELGLDIEKFREDMRSDRVNRTVQADLAYANRQGYSSTPTFEINGEKIENPRDVEGFKKLIDDAIKKQSVE